MQSDSRRQDLARSNEKLSQQHQQARRSAQDEEESGDDSDSEDSLLQSEERIAVDLSAATHSRDLSGSR